jgi:hypothetical protein
MGFIVNMLKKVLPVPQRIALRKILARHGYAQSAQVAAANKMALKEKFSVVYEKNIFDGKVSRSGNGSDDIQTQIIQKVIPGIVSEFGVKSFLDAPCGDWFWMQKVTLPATSYLGVDIVNDMIESNKKRFGNTMVDFKCVNLVEDDLPRADLIFSRDCLVHLSFDDALKIISNFKRSGARYLLTTTFSERKQNEDLGKGFWRTLNLTKEPFYFPEPLRLINEGCTEGNSMFADKCLGLWLLDDIHLDKQH